MCACFIFHGPPLRCRCACHEAPTVDDLLEQIAVDADAIRATSADGAIVPRAERIGTAVATLRQHLTTPRKELA